ncbi:MAG: hypothetical protein CMP89_08410 [Gammaproteobacteria bacterium]|nr:hypothetical protein [Gammaproteobacteria bacterium]
MSYQVLARKYRPTNFNKLEGQEHVLRALINALDQERLHHAYLFTGTRGVGKTTIARILARCLNCETGITSQPCGTCSSCGEISEGRSVDLIEVDAASRTGVDDMRELLDNVQYMPSVSRFKIYLIDEVHMLSRSSFNAMLKTLEEPPEHVKFLFATTDPKKLPITVLSRCLQFNLKSLSPQQIVKYLGTVLDQESLTFDEAALWLLGHAADGSMRDALSLTDQAISYGDNEVREDTVSAMLGSIDTKVVFGLLNDISMGNGENLFSAIDQLSDYSPDFALLLDDLLGTLHRVAVSQAVPGSIDNSQGDQKEVLKAAEHLSREQVQLLYQIGLIGQRDLPLAPTPRIGFEMVLLRMMSFCPSSLGSAFSGPENNHHVSANQGGPFDVASSEPKGSQAQTVEVKLGESKTTEDVKERSESVNRKLADPLEKGEKRVPLVELMSAINGDSQPVQIDESETLGLLTPSAEQVVSETIEATGQKKEALPAVNLEPGYQSSDISEESNLAVSSRRLDSNDRISFAASNVDPMVMPALHPDNWSQILSLLNLGGVTRTLAANCLLCAVSEDGCLLKLAEHHASLWNASHEDRIANSLSELYGKTIKVDIEVGDTEIETPAARADRERQEKQIKAVTEIENDKRVQQLLENFDGRIDADSISPLKTGDL